MLSRRLVLFLLFIGYVFIKDIIGDNGANYKKHMQPINDKTTQSNITTAIEHEGYIC